MMLLVWALTALSVAFPWLQKWKSVYWLNNKHTLASFCDNLVCDLPLCCFHWIHQYQRWNSVYWLSSYHNFTFISDNVVWIYYILFAYWKEYFFFLSIFINFFRISFYAIFLGLSCTSTCLSISAPCHCDWCMFTSWKGYWCTGRTN